MGVPLFQIKSLIEQRKVAIFASNLHALRGYAPQSRAGTLSVFTGPRNYSIDESFLVMPPCDPRITGDEIKRRVIQ